MPLPVIVLSQRQRQHTFSSCPHTCGAGPEFPYDGSLMLLAPVWDRMAERSLTRT
jgi:hypothetical protein